MSFSMKKPRVMWGTCVFVSGQPPERTFAENIAPLHGMHMLLRGLRYTVDTEKHEVAVTSRRMPWVAPV